VEVVLEGSGSSRHHPETILASLPYVDYFKFKNKKHLYLQIEPTHELGVINELKGSQLRNVKRALDNQDKFDPQKFSNKLKNTLSSLKVSIEELSVKYPGEIQSSNAKQAIDELIELQETIEATVIASSNSLLNISLPNVDDFLNSTAVTGFDDGGVDRKIETEGGDEDEDEDDVVTTSSKASKELSAARVRTLAPTFSLLFDRMKYEEIELQPEFQRRDRIWKTKDKSALVESVLIGLPIPNLYFAEKPTGDWIVVDGLQRITTLKDYMEGKFALSGLTVLDELNGFKFEELSRYFQRKYREYSLNCNIITMDNNDDRVVREIFQRINTNGSSLSYQEIRCALYSGTSVKFIRYMAEGEAFKKTTFEKISSARMKDMEFVLGTVAFSLFGYSEYRYSRFDTFLGEAMKALNLFKVNIEGEFLSSEDKQEDKEDNLQWHANDTATVYIELKEKIEQSFSIAEDIFGNDRYRKTSEGTAVISKPLFELIISTFTHLTQNQIDTLFAKRDIFKKEFFKLLANKRDIFHDWESQSYIEKKRDFLYSISQSTGKRVTILYRFQNFQSLVEDVVGSSIKFDGLFSKYADWNSKLEKWEVKEEYADQLKTKKY
jgi:hypothetical protein